MKAKSARNFVFPQTTINAAYPYVIVYICFSDLQAVVSEYITENLDVDFAANALHAAVYFEVAHLETKCLRFIAQNAQAFLKSKSYLDMGEQAFIKVD